MIVKKTVISTIILFETLETILEKRLHFHTVDHQLKVYGYCEECEAKRKAAGLDNGFPQETDRD